MIESINIPARINYTGECSMTPSENAEHVYQGDKTALMAAAARHLAIGDDHAKALVNAAHGPSLESFPKSMVERAVSGLFLRTKFLDEVAEDHVATKIQQVVILGSGLDTRAWRCSWPAGVHIWHLDREETVFFPQEVLDPPRGVNLHSLIVDFSDEKWPEELVAEGFDVGVPTLFIAEAVFLYLPLEVATRVVRQAAEISGVGSVLGFTYLGEGNTDQGVVDLASATSALGGDFLSAISSPGEFLSGSGWVVDDAVTYGQYADRLGEAWMGDEGGGVSWLCRAVRS